MGPVKITTTLLPDFVIDIDKPADQQAGVRNLTGIMLSILKPRIEVDGIPVLGALEFAPAGEPGETKWPIVSVVLLIGGAFAVYLMYRGIRSLGK